MPDLAYVCRAGFLEIRVPKQVHGITILQSSLRKVLYRQQHVDRYIVSISTIKTHYICLLVIVFLSSFVYPSRDILSASLSFFF